MPCFAPLRGVRGSVNSNGKRPFSFVTKEVDRAGWTESVPCGQCRFCRLEYSRQWAARCMDESRMYKRNCFITLTFSAENLLVHGPSLFKPDFQLFMKRLRKYAKSCKVRYYQCGEYGEKYGRPHYHALLFNWDFADKVYFKRNALGQAMYRSSRLEKLWPYGHSLIGSVTFESAAYVARYMMDRVTETVQVKDEFGRVVGRELTAKYIAKYLDKGTGELLEPEYCTMSRRDGLGTGFYKKFKLDMYPHDLYYNRGMKMKPPKFYDTLLEREDAGLMKRLKMERYASRNILDNTPDRLAAKEEVLISRLKLLSRSLEV